MARPAGKIRVGCSRRRRRLSCLGKVTQRAKDWWEGGNNTQLPVGPKPCPATTVTPFSCLLRSGAAEGAARNAVPARAQSPSPGCPGRPSAQPCMRLLPPHSEQQQLEFVVPKRANTVGRGGTPGGNESSPGPAAGKSLRGCFCRVRCWGSCNALCSRMP